MRIAPDVEQMMWMVAESADPVAVQDFESRFPHLRYELSKRIDMVRKLKASGKFAKHEGSIPRFRPKSAVPAPGMRVRWSLAAVALSALAFGSFYGTKAWVARSAKPAENPPPLIQPLPKDEQPVVQKQPKPAESPVPQDPEPTPQNGLVPPDDEPPALAKWMQPTTVKFERIGLATAIQAIAAQSGLKVEMPADMPNEDVVVSYQGMTGIEILQDMAPRFGFSVFDQGDGKVLIVPARDENDPREAGDPAYRPIQPKNVHIPHGKAQEP